MLLFLREGTLLLSIFCKVTQIIVIYLFYSD